MSPRKPNRTQPCTQVQAAVRLRLKDESQYGFGDIAATKLRRALRRAGTLIGFATEVLRK